MVRKSCLIISIVLLVLFVQPSRAVVKNVILMIGDGMGFEQVKAASLYAYGDEECLPFEKYYRGEVTTHSANSYLQDDHATDSAASATAMATGQKVNNKVISQKSGKPIKTILEYFKEQGKATGLLTTKYLTDATPAGFAAHTKHRENYSEIADDYLKQTRPNILFGAYLASGKGLTEEKSANAGYTVVKTREQMMHAVEVVGQNSIEEVFIAGLFSPDAMPWEYNYYYPDKNPLSQLLKRSTPSYDTVPHLSEMTEVTLNILDNDPNGFFLMVEGARIDSAGHDNLIKFNVFETLEFANAFQVALDWAENRNDTLIIVTADHECGGLVVKKNCGRGFMPKVFWGSTGHTGLNVPIYAVGEGAKEFVGVIDNTEIFSIIMKLTLVPSVARGEQSRTVEGNEQTTEKITYQQTEPSNSLN
jgi:alkaline phosphatase